MKCRLRNRGRVFKNADLPRTAGGRLKGTQIGPESFLSRRQTRSIVFDAKPGRKPMIGKSALALVAAAAAVSLTSAASAQSADRYGSMLPYHYDSSGVQVWGSWGPQQS